MFDAWTGNGTIFTIPFYRFWDDDYKDIIYDGDIKQLFPNVPEFTEQMRDEIKEHFYYRQIAEETPQKFLHHLHQTIRLSSERWARLIATETALRPDDAIYNYDMIESESGNTSSSTTTHDENKTSGADTSYTSDTPDGAVSDIETYMSGAGHNVSNGTGESDGTGSATGTYGRTLTRKGNIGVMTSAQIMGGYRDATEWSAWRVIFAELESLFLGVF